ncbi:hypothetical protein GE21DRAFT_1215972, partial [Neurospora crassa]
IFNLFALKNIILSLKKSFITYPNIKLLGFKVNILELSTINERMAAFRNLKFLNTLKSLERYISTSKFIRYLIPYYTKLIKLL